jgi:hypothetical protein
MRSQKVAITEDSKEFRPGRHRSADMLDGAALAAADPIPMTIIPGDPKSASGRSRLCKLRIDNSYKNVSINLQVTLKPNNARCVAPKSSSDLISRFHFDLLWICPSR